MLEVINWKRVSISTHKITKCLNSIFYITRTLKLIIFSKSKGFRCKYSSKTISVICELKKLGQSHCEIIHQLEILQSSITTIFYQKTRQLDNPSKLSKQPGRFSKLDSWVQQAIICYVKEYPHNNLYTLSTLFKSSHIID